MTGTTGRLTSRLGKFCNTDVKVTANQSAELDADLFQEYVSTSHSGCSALGQYSCTVGRQLTHTQCEALIRIPFQTPFGVHAPKASVLNRTQRWRERRRSSRCTPVINKIYTSPALALDLDCRCINEYVRIQ